MLRTNSITEFLESVSEVKDQESKLNADLGLLNAKLDTCKQELTTTSEALHEIKHMVEAIQHSTYGQIERLVTHCLQYVFGGEYSCSIVTDQSAHGVTAEIVVNKGDLTLSPMSSCGGGVVDVVSFALRLASVVGDARQNNRKLLILDEPFRFLSAVYKPRVAQLVEDLAEDYDFQIILITHDDEFTCGLIHKVG